MDNERVVQWQHSYSVGVRPIDEQHMELIRLTNKLFISCMAGQRKGSSAFLDAIHEAVEYTGYHFGTEEKIMQRINYPDYARHKKEHTDFVREVYSMVEEYKTGKMLVSLQFVYYLRDWVLHHIAVSDKRLGEYLLLLKRNGDLQRMTVRVRKDTIANRMLIK
jgi:hemerythrin-like metal-binding protein